MRQFVSLGRVLVVSLMLTSGLTACSSLNPFSEQTIENEPSLVNDQRGQLLWSSGQQYVKLVNKGRGSALNNHPVHLSSADLNVLLSSAYVNEGFIIKSLDNPIFSAGELEDVSTILANALAQAGPDEDVTFATIGYHPGAFDKESKATSARVFVKDGQLHLIFGLLHDDYEAVYDGNTSARSKQLAAGTRLMQADLSSSPSLSKGQFFYRDPKTGDEREDWLVIDIEAVLSSEAHRATTSSSLVSSELLQDVAQNKEEADNIREDLSSMKEVLFELSGEIERLKREVESLKARR